MPTARLYPFLVSGLLACGWVFNVRGTSRQTAEMLEKYLLPALPCAKN